MEDTIQIISQSKKTSLFDHFFFFLFLLICRVHDGRKAYQFQEFSQTSEENILCLGSSRKQPVIRWEKNMAWPGKLTLTDKALYFKVLLQTNFKKFMLDRVFYCIGSLHLHQKLYPL